MQPNHFKDEDKKEKMIKENISSTLLTKRYLAAMDYAISRHKDQTRKQTNIPYVSHCLAVSSLVLEAGGDEDQTIAGLAQKTPEATFNYLAHRRIWNYFFVKQRLVRGYLFKEGESRYRYFLNVRQ